MDFEGALETNMWKNIARRTVYGWPLWRHIERERKAISTNQMERWHLRDMHLGSKVSYLTRWLTSHVAAKTRTGDVTVHSTWIDHYPQAHSAYLAGAATRQVSVELADLLLVVKVQDFTGGIVRESAVLLQAKCANDPECLDQSYGGSSTDDERHLLEACCADIRVTSAAGPTSPPINSVRASYNLGASPTNLGLESYARYLLVPREECPCHQPYMTVWPQSLSAYTGSLAHFSEVMLAMIGIGKPSTFAGANVNISAAMTDWDFLVKDLIDYCSGQPLLNRFKTKTGMAFPRHIQRSYDVRTFYPFRAMIISLLRKVFEDSWLERMLQLQLIPSGPGRMPPPEREDDSEDPPAYGFTLLQVTITVPKSLDQMS